MWRLKEPNTTILKQKNSWKHAAYPSTPTENSAPARNLLCDPNSQLPCPNVSSKFPTSLQQVSNTSPTSFSNMVFTPSMNSSIVSYVTHQTRLIQILNHFVRRLPARVQLYSPTLQSNFTTFTTTIHFKIRTHSYTKCNS